MRDYDSATDACCLTIAVALAVITIGFIQLIKWWLG